MNGWLVTFAFFGQQKLVGSPVVVLVAFFVFGRVEVLAWSGVVCGLWSMVRLRRCLSREIKFKKKRKKKNKKPNPVWCSLSYPTIFGSSCLIFLDNSRYVQINCPRCAQFDSIPLQPRIPVWPTPIVCRGVELSGEGSSRTLSKGWEMNMRYSNLASILCKPLQ